MNIGVIASGDFSKEEEIVKEGDEGTEAGGAEPGDDTDEDGEQPECGRRQVAASRCRRSRSHFRCRAKKASPSSAEEWSGLPASGIIYDDRATRTANRRQERRWFSITV
jgi:hypothetical protein